MISRRDLIRVSGQAYLGAQALPLVQMVSNGLSERSMRCINVINFIRGVEPREPMDLILPVQKQMESVLEHKLPATWLLQYDALASGPFVAYLKAHIAANHEVGIWFEMNEMHCKAAGVEWRGRPGYEWDHIPSVAFTLGYTPEERIKLADTFMTKFKEVWGFLPKSVASWNLDSITAKHLSAHYGVDAFAVCRDQIATDGFTIWGAPIAGYYPSKVNCWSPGLSRETQVNTPVFRMLGQDPVYYYQSSYPFPDGQRHGGPDTMEPVWPSGRSTEFIDNFLQMIAESPTLSFAYAQLGQENSFGWPEMADAFPRQMEALAKLRDHGAVHVETMGESGRRFKHAFRETPAQAQIMLKDPFGNTNPAEKTIWYQSRFYRADLHIQGDLPFLRDLTVYSDHNPQPFLKQATRQHDVEQRMPAVLDGYHWSNKPGSSEPGAAGFFVVDGEKLRLSGEPKIRESGSVLEVELPIVGGRILNLKFEEKKLSISLKPSLQSALTLSFEWDPSRSALVSVSHDQASYLWQEFDYSVKVQGKAEKTDIGWKVSRSGGPIILELAQPA